MIRLSIHEVMCASSCLLFMQELYVIASIFLALSVLGAISRAALDIQDRKEKVKEREEAYQNVAHLGSILGDSLSKVVKNLEKN